MHANFSGTSCDLEICELSGFVCFMESGLFILLSILPKDKVVQKDKPANVLSTNEIVYIQHTHTIQKQ